uniref:diguanylate cyclase n=1 Tax=Dechloromonas aromatica (strain RCB) TaxID=159087 RepID=Q47FH1_DECAR
MTIKTEIMTSGQSATQNCATPHWTIHTLLGWLVIICLIPGIVGTVIFFFLEYSDGRDRLEKDTIQTARALVQAVDAHLLKAEIAAQSLSTAGSLSKRNFADFHRRATELLATNKQGRNVVLTDPSGQQIVNTLKPFGQLLPKHGNFTAARRVFETGKPLISDLFMGELTQHPVMSIDVPVLTNEKVSYVLSIGIDPNDFSGILLAQRLPDDWVAAIFDTTGTIVSRTHNAEQFVGQKGTAEFIQRFQESQEGGMETTTREGIPVFSVFSRSAVTGWTVGIGIPRKSLEAELKHKLLIMALGMMAVFGFGIVLAWLIGGRIAVSVRALQAPAKALGAGEPLPATVVHIKEAAEVLGAMSEAAILLEQRTASLQSTYQALLAREKELLEAHRVGKFGIWQWNPKSHEINVSEEIRHIYGRDVPPFPEQRGTLLSIESWERVNAAAQEAIKTGIGYDLKLQAYRNDGSQIWIHARCEAIRDAEGDILALRGTVQDITERIEGEKALRNSEIRFRATFEQAAVGMAHVSLDGKWLHVNDKTCEIVGYSRETLLGLTFQEITYPPDLNTDLDNLQKLLAGSISSYSMEKRYVRRDATLTWVNLTVALVRTSEGQPDYFVSVLEDIQSRKEAEAALDEARKVYRQHLEQQVAERTEALLMANQELERLAHQDALTKLPNRLAANERLRQEFLRLKRTGSPYCVFMMDIDHFKMINDTYGHETGDHVLEHFAVTLTGALRATDFVARFGGEEFIALMPDTEIEGAMVAAEKVRIAIHQEKFPVVGCVTVSIGVGNSRTEDANEDETVRRADAALYRSKKDGRNRVSS